MAPHAAVPDVRSALEAVTSEVGRLLGGRPASGVLLRGRRGRPEPMRPGALPEAVLDALAHESAGTLAGLVRRTEEPFVVRATGLPGEPDGVAAALRAHAMEGLALLPLLGEVGAVGCLVIPVPSEWDWPEGQERHRILSLAPTVLQVAAGSALLEVLLNLDGDRPGARPAGAVVVDGDERVILADGILRETLEWRHPDPFGRPLMELPPCHLREAPAAAGPSGFAGVRVLLVPGSGVAGGGTPSSWTLQFAGRVHAAAGAVAGALRPLGAPISGLGALGDVGDVAHRARALARSMAEQAAAGGEVRVDLADVASAVLEGEADSLARARVRVFSFIAPAPCPVPGDLLVLRGVLRVLVGMAKSALSPFGGTLTVRTWTEDGWACAAVSDDGSASRPGSGDPVEAHEPDADGDPERGLGEVEAAVESLGGRFNVERRPGVWNRCTFMIPTAPRQAPAARPTETRVRRDAKGGLSVLVVDDNPALRSVLRRYLERRGHRVTEATDGDDALRVVGRGDPFDRLIVDIQMPGKSGPELFGSLSTVAPELCARTLFMTGDLMEANTERFLVESGRPAIAKPFDLADLVRKLEGAA